MRLRAAILLTASVALMSIVAPARAWAHPVPFSYLDVHVEPDRVDASVIVHIFDAGHDLNLDEPERLLDPGYLASLAPQIVALLAPRLVLRVDGQTVTPDWSSAIEALPDRQSIRLHARYPLRTRPGQVSVTARLFPYDPEHRTFVNIYEGDHLTQAILEPSHPDFEYFAGTRQGVVAVIKKFLVAGIHHILIGPDHLLFLVGLLLLGGSVGRLAGIVTAFTVAHSVTLTLAALNLFSPPARLIEPAIALSIICVGADNLLVSTRPGGRDLRAAMAFAFGFIHGFGFATVLREMDLPSRALGWSLFSFNAGVEIGQLLVVIPVAIALSILWARSETAGRRLAWAGSVVVVAAGVFWFAQRVFFLGGSV